MGRSRGSPTKNLKEPHCPSYHQERGEGVSWSTTKCRCVAGENGGKCKWCLEKEREELEAIETEQALKNCH